MDNINLLKNQFQNKNSDYLDLISKSQKTCSELNSIKYQINKEIEDYVNNSRESFLQKHIHYKEKHKLEITEEYFYDYDWFRDTYGKRYPVDEYGREYVYEGNNIIVFSVCKSCELSYKKDYDNKDLAYDKNIIGNKIFEELILQNYIDELKLISLP